MLPAWGTLLQQPRNQIHLLYSQLKVWWYPPWNGKAFYCCLENNWNLIEAMPCDGLKFTFMGKKSIYVKLLKWFLRPSQFWNVSAAETPWLAFLKVLRAWNYWAVASAAASRLLKNCTFSHYKHWPSESGDTVLCLWKKGSSDENWEVYKNRIQWYMSINSLSVLIQATKFLFQLLGNFSISQSCPLSMYPFHLPKAPVHNEAMTTPLKNPAC